MSRIITPAELHTRTLSELQALLRAVQRDLAAAAPDSPAQRCALASLQNIRQAIRLRQMQQPGFQPRF